MQQVRERGRRPRRRIRPGKYIPNAITILNMFFGFLSIIFSIQGLYELAAWMIFVGAISDGLDGKVARAMGTTSDFGIQFDSLADLVTFCMAPSVMVYVIWAEPLGPVIGGFFAFMPLMLGAIRLARFNLEANNNQKTKFLGVPSPLMAVTIAGFYLFFLRMDEYGLSDWMGNYPEGDSRVVLPMVMILSTLMLSKVPFPKSSALTLKHGFKKSLPFLGYFSGLLAIVFTKGLALFPLAMFAILTGLVRWTQTHNHKQELESEELT